MPIQVRDQNVDLYADASKRLNKIEVKEKDRNATEEEAETELLIIKRRKLKNTKLKLMNHLEVLRSRERLGYKCRICNREGLVKTDSEPE